MLKRVIALVVLLSFILPMGLSLTGTIILAAPDDEQETESLTLGQKIGIVNKEIGDKEGNTITKILASGIAILVVSFQHMLEYITPFETLDGLLFNKDADFSGVSSNKAMSRLPLSDSQWSTIIGLYKNISLIMSALAIIPVTLVSFKFMRAGNNSKLRETVFDDFKRLFVSAFIVVMTPVVFPALLFLNNKLIEMLHSMLSNGASIEDMVGSSGSVFTSVEHESAIGYAVILAGFAYVQIKLSLIFVVRNFTLMVFFVFTPIMAMMWNIDKSVNAVGIWVGELLSNIFMQFFYAFVLIIFLAISGASGVDGKQINWLVSLTWITLVLKLGDVLRNSVQGALARMSGLDETRASAGGIGLAATAIAGAATIGKGAMTKGKRIATGIGDMGSGEGGGLAGDGLSSGGGGGSSGVSAGSMGNGVSLGGNSGPTNGSSGGSRGMGQAGGVVGATVSATSKAGGSPLKQTLSLGGAMAGMAGSGIGPGGPGVVGGGLGGGVGGSAGDEAGATNTSGLGALTKMEAGDLSTKTGTEISGNVIGDSGEDPNFIDVDDYTVLPDEPPEPPRPNGPMDNISYKISRNQNAATITGRFAENVTRAVTFPASVLGGEVGANLSKGAVNAVGWTARTAVAGASNVISVAKYAKKEDISFAQAARKITNVPVRPSAGKLVQGVAGMRGMSRMAGVSMSSPESAANKLAEYKITDRFGRPNVDGMRFK